MIMNRRGNRLATGTVRYVVACGIAAAMLVAFGAHGIAADRRISMARLQSIADQRIAPAGVVIPTDESTLEWVNKTITAGRKWSRDGLARLREYYSVVLPSFARHGVPAPMVAIPFGESGVGGPVTQSPTPGAPGPRGIWQMTADTARELGLTVNDESDERFNPIKEAEAAAVLLESLYGRYRDWILVAAAYHAGTKIVDDAIAKAGTKDAAALASSGLLDKYLNANAAMMVVIHAPELVQ